jgi:hypothetical protein
MHIQKIHLAMVMAIIPVFIVGISFGCKAKKAEEAKTMTQLAKLPDIKERLAKYSPTEMTFDKTRLSAEDTKVLEKLVLAAKGIDTIFWKQAYPPGLALKEELERSADPADQDYLRFLKINFGPFDRQEENKPFIGTSQKPAGAGFYPPDLTKQEFENYVAQHPEIKESFESSFTVIKRENGKLVAVPYNIEYKGDLESIAQYLREAAELTTNESLKKYLSRRAQDLLANDYFQSDCDWIDLKDNLVEIVIGPYEVYEDSLCGLKASYESYVYLNDREEMKKIKGYLSFLDEMQRNLPVEQKYKDQKVGSLESPLNVVSEVFTAGDAKAGIQTSAFVLPNDEKVREKKGTKKVFLKNVMEAKFNKSLLPISERVLSAEDTKLVSFDAYFNETILHEICHALGVNYVTLPDGTKTTVNKALKDLNSAIEEAKADIVGLYHVPFLIEKGWFPVEKEKEAYTTYLAGIFRALRFGATEAHGLGTLLQFNFLREKGIFVYDPVAKKFKVDFGKIKDAVRELARQLLVLEGDGNYDNVRKFIDRYRNMDNITKHMIEKLADIPVDIAPIFRIAEVSRP